MAKVVITATTNALANSNPYTINNSLIVLNRIGFSDNKTNIPIFIKSLNGLLDNSTDPSTTLSALVFTKSYNDNTINSATPYASYTHFTPTTSGAEEVSLQSTDSKIFTEGTYYVYVLHTSITGAVITKTYSKDYVILTISPYFSYYPPTISLGVSGFNSNLSEFLNSIININDKENNIERITEFVNFSRNKNYKFTSKDLLNLFTFLGSLKDYKFPITENDLRFIITMNTFSINTDNATANDDVINYIYLRDNNLLDVIFETPVNRRTIISEYFNKKIVKLTELFLNKDNENNPSFYLALTLRGLISAILFNI